VRRLLLTRASFEEDLCAELRSKLADVALQIDQAGVVFAESAQSFPAWHELAFAREVINVHASLDSLPSRDRAQYLQARWPAALRAHSVHVYAPDADQLRTLAPTAAALQKAFPSRADAPLHPSAHLVFLSASRCVIGEARARISAPVASGVPRLKFPSAAPSRSTLKLDEALLHLLSKAEHAQYFQPGMQAVDLGACPGGWTYQLVRRGLHVIAIDNGRMDDALMRTNRVTHVRADGFRWLPPKPVDWMVCDMVESPLKVADLAVQWLSQRHCRNAVVNLKLPMKKRAQALLQCLEKFTGIAGLSGLRVKQLFHDREEVTVLALTQPLMRAGHDKLRASKASAESRHGSKRR
jgi:23S rRNA (cytidine2498-2'-O)-methyltransferase